MINDLFQAPKILDIAVIIFLGRIALAFYNYNREKVSNKAIFSDAYIAAREYQHIHHAQSESWDCGVACCLMVRQWSLGASTKELLHSDSLRDLFDSYQVRPGRPLWTIEIFLLLNKFGINCTMFTLSKGIESHHSNYAWYRDTMEEDIGYVYKAFQDAEVQGLSIRHQTVSLSQLKSYLKNPQRNVAIILINNMSLQPLHNISSADCYKGHYILLLVYDSSDDSFLYFDPADSSAQPSKKIF